jgi:hypothetical protein
MTSSIGKLIVKLKGNLPALGITLILVIAVVIGLLLLAGLFLAFGLNLMGFHIPYSINTAIGGAIVISILRSGSVSTGEK